MFNLRVAGFVLAACLVLLAPQAFAGIPGDANGDDMVDVADYTAWFNHYGMTNATLADGDFNGDGSVDVADYTIWFNNYGAKAGQTQMTNLKIVTDGNPDYSDMDSMVRSITSNWATNHEKAWAMFYWNHIARRQTAPMEIHGVELTDPIMQFNDYGYTMCSTISGTNCSIFGYMGWPVNFVDISNHTVMQVGYEDGLYHMHDNSLSMLYTICDGSRLANVNEIGASGTCSVAPTSTTGHIAKYHAIYGTSPLGFCQGSDDQRSLEQMASDFWPSGIKNRTYYRNWNWGHRYILNLRPNEIYTRTYHVTGSSTNYFVPNPPPGGSDPEAANTRYHIRGNGQWVFTPSLTAGEIAHNTISISGLAAMDPGPGIQPKDANTEGAVVYKIEGANVITSMKIDATFKRATSSDVSAVDVSVNNGLTWSNVWTNSSTGTALKTINLLWEVNGYYEVLVKVRLKGVAAVTDAQMTTLKFTTITMVNSKTQPMLRLGKNTVYVDRGDNTGSVSVWPNLVNYGYRMYSVSESNVTSGASAGGYMGDIWAKNTGQEAYVVFKVDTPGPMTKLTYGGRLYNRGLNSHIDFLHSFDGGATWTQSYTLTNTNEPWDVIHYETVTTIPTGCKSALVKYRWNSYQAGQDQASIYAVRMEANYQIGDTSAKPLEITYTWKERQTDYSTVTRSHVQLVTSLPNSYTINVGGADHPVMESLQVNQQGAAGPVTYGYSDGRDVGGTKFQDRFVTFGNILSVKKSYTCDKASRTNWGAGDPKGTILTDGVVGSSYTGGTTYIQGAQWIPTDAPVNITVDLGASKQMGAFRIHVFGYDFWDAMKGQVKDKAEVLTSTDNTNWTSRGLFDFNLRWKNIPVNYMWTDEETFCGHNFELILPSQISARYVRFKLTPARFMTVSEVQVLDGITYTPFDLKLAPPPAFASGGGAIPAVTTPADSTLIPKKLRPTPRHLKNAVE